METYQVYGSSRWAVTGQLLRPLIDWLLPCPCVACQRAVEQPRHSLGLCRSCRSRCLPSRRACEHCGAPLSPEMPAELPCYRCRREGPMFERLLVGWSYAAPMDAVVRALKFRRLDYLGGQLGQVLAARFRRVLENRDFVLPVPLHWRRRWARGYDQSELIARSLAHEISLPLRRGLVRVRSTPAQSGLGRSARVANLEGAFRARERMLKGRRVILVDDVLTTGSTLRAAESCIRRAGASSVLVVVAARTPDEESANG